MNLQIFKLKSGEEIICDVTEQLKTKVTVKDPWIFVFETTVDPSTGMPYQMTSVQDWLMLTKVKIITLPTNHIAAIIVPSPEAKAVYFNALKRVKELKKINALMKKNNKNMKHLPPLETDEVSEPDAFANFNDFMEKMFDMARQQEETPEDVYNNTKEPQRRPSQMPQNMIHMSMVFPSEVIITLLEAGIIQMSDMKRIAKEVKKKTKFTGDEKDRPDFGNKFSDWNPDLNSDDYKDAK